MRVGSIRRCLLALVLVGTVVNADPFAYVSNALNDTVSVIDTSSNNVVATIPVGGFPGLIESSPDGKAVYVACRTGSVDEIDTATNTVVGSFPASGSHALDVTPDGKYLYATEHHAHTVAVFDTATRARVKTITGGGSGPFWLAIAPDGKRAYVAYYGSNRVAVIDTATNSWTTNIYTGFGPWGIAITPDGKRVYVTNSLSHNVAIVDTASGAITHIGGVGKWPRGIHISPDGLQATVGVVGQLNLIDTTTNSISATIPMGLPGGVLGAVYTPDGTRVYATVEGLDGVKVIDPVAKKIVDTVALPTGSAPQAITMVFVEPTVLLDALIDDVAALDLKGGLEKSLVAKLDGALDKLEDGNAKNDVAAANKIKAFINAVKAQRGKALTKEEADDLIEAAEDILDKL